MNWFMLNMYKSCIMKMEESRCIQMNNHGFTIEKSQSFDICFMKIKNKFRDYFTEIFSENHASDYLVYHAKKGKDIAGHIVLRYFFSTIEIRYLFVEKYFRRKGIAGKLLDFAYREACLAKCSFITLETIYEDSLDLYKKHGYKVEFVREYPLPVKRYFLKKDIYV